MPNYIYQSQIILLVYIFFLLPNVYASDFDEQKEQNQKLILKVFDEETPNEPTSELLMTDFVQGKHYQLVEVFTANTLAEKEVKLGLEIEYGIKDNLSLGTDLPSMIIGIPTFNAKWRFLEQGSNYYALSIQAAWFSLDTIAPWAPVQEHYDKLEARLIKPALVWTHQISPRLALHTYWTVGIGNISATLSEEGKRKAWEQKHPGGNYDNREKTPRRRLPDDRSHESSESANLEKASSETSDITRRTLEMQSILGLSTDTFQLTGEYTRASGHKILITSRIEKLGLENLQARTYRLTIAQQWVKESFQFRLGIGALYLKISGEDLDGEKIDNSSNSVILPVSDISFYWRL